jgi:hypothetical protein
VIARSGCAGRYFENCRFFARSVIDCKNYIVARGVSKIGTPLFLFPLLASQLYLFVVSATSALWNTQFPLAAFK